MFLDIRWDYFHDENKDLTFVGNNSLFGLEWWMDVSDESNIRNYVVKL